MERPYTEDEARTAALDDRPTPRRNRRFRDRLAKPEIAEYEPPSWGREGTARAEDATSALPRDADRWRDASTHALPRDADGAREDFTQALPRDADRARDDFT